MYYHHPHHVHTLTGMKCPDFLSLDGMSGQQIWLNPPACGSLYRVITLRTLHAKVLSIPSISVWLYLVWSLWRGDILKWSPSHPLFLFVGVLGIWDLLLGCPPTQCAPCPCIRSKSGRRRAQMGKPSASQGEGPQKEPNLLSAKMLIVNFQPPKLSGSMFVLLKFFIVAASPTSLMLLSTFTGKELAPEMK